MYVFLLPFFLLSKKSVVLHEIVPRKSFSPVPLWWLLLNQKQSSNMWQMCIYSCENGQQWCLCLVNKYTVTSQNHPSIHQLYPGCLIVRAGLHPEPVVSLLQATHRETSDCLHSNLMPLLFWLRIQSIWTGPLTLVVGIEKIFININAIVDSAYQSYSLSVLQMIPE